MFCTFEGTEGSGKTTCLRLVADSLRGIGQHVVATREPGGTELGERIRALLLESDGVPAAPMASLLLFEAARAQLVRQVLSPALEAGAVILCDRYGDSTLAYQGFGEGLPLETIRQLTTVATAGLIPDLTFLLDIDPVLGLTRRKGAEEWNSMDGRELAFHQRVRAGFLSLAQAEPSRWRVLDATLPPAQLHDSIVEHIQVWQNERNSES